MEELQRIRSQFVDMLLDQDVINILRFLRDMNALNDEEKENVEGWMTSEGKARCLIDTVMKKGARESSLMVDYLTARQPELCLTLGLTPTAQITGEKTKSKSCNPSPGKAKAKDPLSSMKVLEDLPVETHQLLKGPVQNRSKPVKKKPSCSSGQESLPVELSSSPPLKKPASDGKQGNIPNLKVVKPRISKKVELRRVRCEFVKTVKISVIKGLLDDLLEQKVFITEDKEYFMENKGSTKEQAQCLIDMVIAKGEKASRIMIASMKKKYYDLCSTLGLISSPAGVGHKDDKTVVKPRKQNKGNGGRKRPESEEVAKKKSCTVDGSDVSTETCSAPALKEKELMIVAKTLGKEWEQIAIHLGLNIKDLDDIKADRQTDVAMQKLKMLVLWTRRRPPGKATAQDLLNGLNDLEDIPVETRSSLEALIKQ